MELTTYKDLREWAVIGTDTSKRVWFVSNPFIDRKGDEITNKFKLTCYLQDGYLHEVGYERKKADDTLDFTIRFTSMPYSYHENEDFTFTFNIGEDDFGNLSYLGKLFTDEKEALKYYENVREPYLKEVNELNNKYSIKLSDICEKFGIPQEEKDKIVIKRYE